jgi:hypothetical protein
MCVCVCVYFILALSINILTSDELVNMFVINYRLYIYRLLNICMYIIYMNVCICVCVCVCVLVLTY